MIKGSPNISYDLEYSYTFEYVSSNNTDLVPCTYGPVGEIGEILCTENNLNRAIPSGPESVNRSVSDSIAKAWNITQRTIQLSKIAYNLYNRMYPDTGLPRVRY